MPIIYETEHINQSLYTRFIERYIYVQLRKREGDIFLKNWNIVVYPLEAAAEFADFFDHVENETNLGIAWGVTMPKNTKGGDMYLFVRDVRNPFSFIANFGKISHELGHVLARKKWHRAACTRKYNEPAAGAGSKGPCYVTKVHDLYYGSKSFRNYWIRWGLMWVRVPMLQMWETLHDPLDDTP